MPDSLTTDPRPTPAVQPPQSAPPGLSQKVALALAVVLLAAVFFRASNAPVWYLDTWGHWKYGQWITEHHRLPEREPFSVYSDRGAPLLDTWWLSQVLCYRVYAAGGVEGIALFFALVELTKAALYLGALRRASGSLALAVVGLALMQAGRWPYSLVFRPQAIGEVCWATLLFIAARPPWPKWGVVAAPLLVALWANLHGGFLLAFVLLGALLLSRAGDVMKGRLRPSAVLDDAEVRRLGLTLALCLAATGLTPYGPRYLAEVVRFGRTPSLQMVVEWLPPVPLATFGSRALAASVLLVLATLRWSPRRFSPADTILLAVFGLGAWFATRLIPFWMTVWPFVLVPHWRAMIQRAGGDRFVADAAGQPATGGLRAYWPLVPAGACALALILGSATGNWLRGAPLPSRDRLRPETPVAIARALAESSPAPGFAGPPWRVFCSAEWSDYLVWALPSADQVYWYSHWHCYSPQHINDGNYLLKLHGPPHDWRKIIDRYRFNALALRNDGDQDALFGYLLGQWGRPDSEWEVIVYRDNHSPGLRDPVEDLQPAAVWGLLALRRDDPFARGMRDVQGVQNGLGGGESAGGIDFSFLSRLPWTYPERWPDR